MRRFIPLCSFLVLGLVCWFSSTQAAQQDTKVFKILGETRYKQNGFKPAKVVTLTAENAPEGSVLLWNVEGNQADYIESGNSLTLAVPPGSHRVTLKALTVKDGKISIESAEPVTLMVEATKGCQCKQTTGECGCGKK